MSENWNWVGRYVSVIVIAGVLAAALGSMELFQATTILNKKLSAAHIVRFLGYGAALAVLWLLAQRAALALGRQGGRWSFLRHLVLPLAMLIVVASAHSVILLVLRPMMDTALRNTYNWLFIAGIIAAAAWLIIALFNQSSPLAEAFTSAAQRLGSGGKSRVCTQCGTRAEPSAKFCSACGAKLAD
ncbi:MAG TPA: zinc ribbon domain-containing protein [Burkholderiales bacterium]|nr:zinc ribbon domain-containing protein [Burkholderiales bacterium]